MDIPGPVSKTGDGYDWVMIESIENDKRPERDFEQVAINVHTTSNPESKDPAAAHFFKKGATIIVIRDRNILRAEVHGRNE